MKPRPLTLLSLAAGLLLLGPAKAQKPSELAPKDTIAAIRVPSLDWLEKTRDALSKATGKKVNLVDISFLTELHDLSGVDRGKPFYVFVTKQVPMPWVALPVGNKDSFMKGSKLPGKPLTVGSFGLLSPAMVMADKAPELGQPLVEGLSEKGLAVRVLARNALAAFGRQLMQFQAFAPMIAAQAAEGDPKKAQVFTQGIQTIFQVVNSLELLDLNLDLSEGGKVALSGRITPKEKSILGDLVKVFRPRPLPPSLVSDPLLWFSIDTPQMKELPEEIQNLLKGMATLANGEADKEKEDLFGSSVSFSAGISPAGRLLLGIVGTVKDPKALKPAFSSKEKTAALVRDLVPGGLGKDDGFLSFLENLLRKGEFQPEALTVGDSALAALQLPVEELLKGLSPKDAEKFKKLLGDDSVQVLTGLVGQRLVMALGPKGEVAAVAKGLTRTGASKGIFSAGLSVKKLLQTITTLSGKTPPKGLDLSKLSSTPIRLLVTGDGKCIRGTLTGNLEALAALASILKEEGD